MKKMVGTAFDEVHPGELPLAKWIESFPASEVSLGDEVMLLVKLG